MATTPERGRRVPRDARARERLREAQQQESQALASVGAAQQALRKACAKRDAATSAAAAAVERAEESVSAAQASLAKVSGLDRAATLLDVSTRDLRRRLGSGRNPDA